VAIRQVLTDEGVMETQTISEDDRITILSQGVCPFTPERMEWH
jgi:hypothetical protein